MNIMIIDDDDAIRMMLQDIIEDYRLGTVVESLPSAATLSNALLAMRQIDILIIDMLMPGIDGIQAVTKIKTGFTGKIIMLSQVESKDLVGKAYEYGVDYYITKPFFYKKNGEKREILKTGYVINQQLTNLRKSCALPQLSGEKHAVGRHA